MLESHSPTLRRRELGALLRKLRIELGLTVEQVAGQLLCSHSKVSRIGTGQRSVSVRDIHDLGSLYGLTDLEQLDHVWKRAGEGRQQDLWQFCALESANYAGLEIASATIKQHRASTGSGLFQTGDYTHVTAEALMSRFAPAEQTTQYP